MSSSLETYYESELNHIRRLSLEFARERPKIADRLLFDRETGEAEDPHVERLIEAFAFLTARIRLKLDDEFPEITDALLGILYPHYLVPIPSMTVVQFLLDPGQGQLTTGHTIPRHSKLYSREVGGLPCRFRTAYPVTLLPIELESATYHTAPFGQMVVPPPRSVGAPAMLRLRLRTTNGLPFSQLEFDHLRFFLGGDDATARTVYELLFNHVTQVMVRPADDPEASPTFVQGGGAIQPVGFGRDEGMLPYGPRSHLGYRLLTEYFTFPSKFLFADIRGMERVLGASLGTSFDLFLFLDRNVGELENRLSKDMFRLGCCPAVNLFTQEADPIRITQTKYEYLVVPDVRHSGAMEVYSLDRVYSLNADTQETKEYQPFFSFKHAQDANREQVYWHSQRRPSLRKGDSGTEVYVTLTDLGFDPKLPAAEVLMLQATCSNRNLPGQLRVTGGESWQFQLDGQAPVMGIVPVVPPTSPARLPWGQNRWRLISHLALNHLSIVGGTDGADALREVLRLYDYADNRVSHQHITGILGVNSRRAVAPIRDGIQKGFCRGMEVSIEFDEDQYAGSGVFLFAAVLERFLALYASLNSATRLVARTKQRGGVIKRWPFRAGEKELL